MFSITTTVLILSYIHFNNHQVMATGSGQFRGGHGSHQHMQKQHEHHVPQRNDAGPVQSVLEDKKLIHDHE